MKSLLDPKIARCRDKEWEQRLVNSIGHVYDDPTKNGCFYIPAVRQFRCHFGAMASAGGGWDHVSVQVSGQNRLPTWLEMCFIKDFFFYPTECVIQYHPPHIDYIDENPRVLHLWRPHGFPIPMPPKEMV